MQPMDQCSVEAGAARGWEVKDSGLKIKVGFYRDTMGGETNH